MAFSSLRNSVPDSSQSDVTILSNPKDYQVYLWSSQPGSNLSLLPTYLWKVLKENLCDFSFIFKNFLKLLVLNLVLFVDKFIFHKHLAILFYFKFLFPISK